MLTGGNISAISRENHSFNVKQNHVAHRKRYGQKFKWGHPMGHQMDVG